MQLKFPPLQRRSPRCFVTIKTKQKHCCRPGRKARPQFSKLSSSWTLSTLSWSREEPSVGWTSCPCRMWRYCMMNTNKWLLGNHCLCFMVASFQERAVFSSVLATNTVRSTNMIENVCFSFSRLWGKVIFKRQL